MNKKINSLSLVLLFSICLLSRKVVKADDFNNLNDMLLDFSMDTIMQQGNMAMDGSEYVGSEAEVTNFMNHDSDETLTFFFDNLDQYQDLDSLNDLENIQDNIFDAIENNEWSTMFNDHFNTDSGLLFPEIEFSDVIDVDAPQEIHNSDITYNSDMPLDDTDNSLEISDSFLEHDIVIEQIDNNIMDNDENDLNLSLDDNNIPENDANSQSLEDNGSNSPQELPETSDEVVIPIETSNETVTPIDNSED